MDEFVACVSIVLLSLLAVVIAVVVYRKRTNSCNNQSSNLPNSYTHCSSKDCFRCSNNHQILHMALTKLSYYTSSNSSTENSEDSLHISADIRKSIERFRNPELQGLSGVDPEKLQKSNPVVFKMAGLKEEALWSVDEFPGLQLLQAHFLQIQHEFWTLYQSCLEETKCLWKINSTPAGTWEIAQLVDQGRKTRAADLCPLTMDVLKKIPQVIRGNIFGDVSFSVVHPNTHIETHCGSTNCRIRCHLGLKVAGMDCILLVGDKICHWQEGKLLCFNDAYPHSVHHQGDLGSDKRVVLIVDLWHPDLTQSQKEILNYAFSI